MRRRQAFYVRAVMEHTDPALWSALQEKHPDLLMNVPTAGRHINWGTLSDATFPLFGAKLRAEQAAAGGDAAGAAQRRIQAHWAAVRLEAEEERRRIWWQRRRKLCCIPSVSLALTTLIVGTVVLLRYAPPPNSVTAIHRNASSVVPEPEPAHNSTVPEPEPAAFECDWLCHALFWAPLSELGVGCVAYACALLWRFVIHRREGNQHDDEDLLGFLCFGAFSAVCAFWPLMKEQQDFVFTVSAAPPSLFHVARLRQ